MANIVRIGKYGKPDIYTEEYDVSGLEQAPVDAGLAVLVLGSSRKGSINTPITLNTVRDLENVYGSIDRNMENKYSYFHRTIAKCLESTSVIAMNIVPLDDNLDKLEYKSLSTSTANLNAVVASASYTSFMDTTGFWKRSTENFLTTVSDDAGNTNRLLHFTNIGDKKITVFLIKSKVTGFDVNMIEWYGGVDKVPAFLYKTDYISDYMIDVLVVAGDFTNYNALAVDKIWSKYFNRTGLRKVQWNNFISEKNLTILKLYEGLSLIPYFRDKKNVNKYIETVINIDTTITGLFCAFDIDKMETSNPSGLVDLIGNNLITGEIDEIEFLGYKETITENVSLSNVYLDTPKNVFAFGSTGSTISSIYRPNSPAYNDRTALYAEGYVYNVTYTGSGNTTALSGTHSGLTVSYAAASDAYAVVGGSTFSISSFTLSIASSNYALSSGATGASESFTETVVISTDGVIKNNPSNADLVNGIVLGELTVVVNRDSVTASTVWIKNVTYTPCSVNKNGFQELIVGTDFTVTGAGTTNVVYEFLNTSGTILATEVQKYRRLKVFNQFANILNSSNKNKATVLTGAAFASAVKNSIADTIVSITNTSSANKKIDLTFASATTAMLANGIALYATDNEFIIGTDKAITKNGKASISEGVVAKYSTLYTKYYDGAINTKDFFYENILGSTMNIVFFDVNGDDYIGFSSNMAFSDNDKIIVPESLYNKGKFTITNPVANTTVNAGYYSFLVNENITAETITAETITGATKLYDANVDGKHYLKFELVNNSTLTAYFQDSALTATSATNNTILDIYSQTSNYRQTVEIEIPTGYTVISNKILVNGARYTELKKGDYLEAVVPTDFEGVPKYLTRILSKTVYSGDSSLVEITCDAEIKKYDFNGDYQTNYFSSVDNFITTYKGVTLNGFKIREACLPNGTEDRQKTILQTIAKGTDLYKSLTNRNGINFRYLVDAYGLGLTEYSKQELVDICGRRLDCIGFINMPSMKLFKNSSNPYFLDDKKILSTEFIALGGNEELNPTFLYSLAQGDGLTSVGYFTPNVTVNDNGRPLSIPPAAFAANTYLRKFTSNLVSVHPWTVSAGVTDGRITGIAGLEVSFDDDDVINLNKMKVNPIVSKGNRGFAIETENTAQTSVVSSLSYLHSREVLIDLERDLRNMLMNFQWKYNTPEVRADIKHRADAICQDYVNRSGLYTFFNKIDEENNTNELIDNQMGVLATYVEVVKNLGVIINQIYIEKTGAINSAGFQL